MRERMGQAAGRARHRGAVRARGVADDAVDRPRPAGLVHLAARPAPAPDEHVNWQVWAQAGRGHSSLWRTFLTEQRALVRELDELVTSVPSVKAPVLLLADPKDTLVPVGTARRLAEALPDARLQLVGDAGHHLPRRASAAVADAITAFVAVDSSSSLR